MIAPRIRAGRSKFWTFVGVVFIVMACIVIFHTSQTQLDESRQQIIHCEHQVDSGNTQIRTLKEHKYRLEKNLESERKEHLETKTTLEQQMKEQKEVHGKSAMEISVRYDSLQQKNKILQSKHDVLEKECTKRKEIQAQSIDSLERKVKSLQSQLNQKKVQFDKEIELWKVKQEHLKKENNRLEVLVSSNSCNAEISKLQAELMNYKSHCKDIPALPSEVSIDNDGQLQNHPLNKPVIQKSFSEQKLVSPNLYKIPIKIIKNTPTIGDGLLLLKPGPAGHEGGVLKSVENFQIAPNPLEQQVVQRPPPRPNSSSSSTTPTNSVNKALHFASPASVSKRSPSTVASKKKAIPSDLGVAPVPENFPEHNLNEDESGKNKDNENNINRYSNILNDLSGKNLNLANGGAEEDENGALEVKHEVLESAHNQGVGESPNDDDTNIFDAKNDLKREQHGELEDDDVEGVGNVNKNNKNKSDEGGESNIGIVGGAGESLLDGDNLNNEVAGDQGKEQQFQDDLNLEENINDEDEDDADDYVNHDARHKEGQAIRN